MINEYTFYDKNIIRVSLTKIKEETEGVIYIDLGRRTESILMTEKDVIELAKHFRLIPDG